MATADSVTMAKIKGREGVGRGGAQCVELCKRPHIQIIFLVTSTMTHMKKLDRILFVYKFLQLV